MELFFCENVTRRDQAYALLVWAARRRWGMEKLPTIARQEGGKPFFPDRPDCCFSISHSGSAALCAVDEKPVGADAERVRPHPPGLARRICGDEELAWLAAQEDRDRALVVLWTGKESMVKCTGTGLTVPIRQIRPPLPPEEEAEGLFFCRRETPGYVFCACGHSRAEGWTAADAALLPPAPPIPPRR